LVAIYETGILRPLEKGGIFERGNIV